MGDLAPGSPNEANEVVAVALTVRSCSVRLGQAGAQAFVSSGLFQKTQWGYMKEHQ